MSSKFLKYFKSELDENGKAKFESIDGKDESLEFKIIADSAYDQTFKRLFSWNLTIDNITGEDRLKSLLNSFFYPGVDDNGYKIKKVIEIRNEKENLGVENQKGRLTFDITCRCICWEKNEKLKVDEKKEIDEEDIFDVEMQTTYEVDFITRLLEYGFSLREIEIIEEEKSKEEKNEDKNDKEKKKKNEDKNDKKKKEKKEDKNDKKKKEKKEDENKKKKKKKSKPVKIISFVNYDFHNTNNINQRSYKTTIMLEDQEGNIIGKYKNQPVEIFVVILPYEINKLLRNEEIVFNEKKISKSGKEWIKLLGVRQWASRNNNTLYHRYIIPRDTDDSDRIIQSAIKILGMISEKELKEYIKNENIFLNQIEGAKEEGEKKRSYEICEAMLNNNENIERILLYSKLSIEEITQFQEKRKKRKLN